jgi:hypothetical protein
MKSGKEGTIELKVEKIAQLFNTLDPMPFRERDLDREAEEYILGWARELPAKTVLRIVVHVPASEAADESAHELRPALNRYFRYRAEFAAIDLNELFRKGRFSLAIGLIVLGVCLTAGHLLTQAWPDNELVYFINEGLVILGWVANWKPIEIFLHDWWPILRRRNLFQRLAAAEVEILPR